MDESTTDSLRKLAPSWTLAGDEQLLNILQSTHQKLLSRCQEANSQLEKMASALNDASISLQNVNNQFMSLSSSQFIESRVYDDDDLTTEPPAPKESPKQEVEDELSCLKRSLSVLEQSHEIITILQDSDTESDTDDEVPARMVLKPKDMYWERPLPYIIGSQPWKNKWHAGLVVEGTDSESSVSERGEDSDQYSHSETEGTRPHTHTLRTQVSETSSSLPSEQGSIPRPTPSDVASDIARRLGAALPNKMVEREPSPEEPPQPASRKVYRPQDPVSSTIFPDEPPPLSEHSDSQDSDIFAEIHRQAGGTGGTGADSRPDGLHRGDGDLFSGIGYQQPIKPPQATVPAPQRTSHRDHHDDYDDDDDDDQTVYNQQGQDIKQTADADVDRGVKKPVGGISLFGNKGTESIGAAILKRNQRKTSTSGDDSDTDTQPQQQIKKEKDIFDDLFARSEGRKVVKDKTDLVKDLKDKVQKKDKEIDKNIEKNEKTKVDLFSDDLFDDIDDIFSSNVTKIATKDNKTTKPIFDDDDDLFSEIAPPKPARIEVATSSNVKKSLFDSDDDLFADNLQAKPDDKPKAKEVEINKAVAPSRVNKEVTRSIFDDDDDDLFNDLKTSKGNDDLKVQSVNIGKADGGQSKKVNENTSTVFKSPSLFDDDDDDDGDLFAKAVTSSIKVNKTSSDINDDVIDDKPSSSSIKTDDLNAVTNDNVVKVNNNNNTDDKIENKNKDLNENVSEDSKNEMLNKNVGNNAAKIFTHIQREKSSSESNNDFSDQDFNDLPPKPDTSNILPDDNKPKPIEKENIFDKTTLEEDIDELFTKAQQNQKTEEIFDEPPPITEIIPEKTEKDNKKPTETDIFNDILTEPPIFEKPKEPKRSKNVNALFDDDSDDESLFFKKNDHVFDDHPNDFTPTQDRIFGLFADEPPDDGFGKASDADDDLFATEPKPKLPSNNNLPPLPVHEIVTENDDKQTKLVEEDIFKVTHVEILKDTKIGDDQRRDDVLEKPKSSFPLSVDDNDDDDDGLFKIPEIPKSSLKETSHLDMSDDENLFSKPEIKPAVVEPTPVLVTEKVQEPELLDDVLFTPEKHEKLKIESKTNIEIDTKSDEELFKVPENKVIPEKVVDLGKTSDDELFSPVKTEKKAENSKLDEDIFKIKAKPEIVNKVDNTQEVKSPDSKKVGKLKVGLNINVNALLPGASPKKVKPSQDQSDGLVQSVDQSQRSEVKILPELQKTQIESQKDVPKPKSDQNPDSTLIKSVSFDGKPESEVLDNKISKERAKIQVKRRPSTRRARREAVRKSAIDFGEDSTDNSSSIDDVPKIIPGNQPEKPQEEKLDKNIETAEIKTTILKDNEAKIAQDGNVDKKLEQAEVNTEKTIIQSKDKTEISDNIAEKQPLVEDRKIEITETPTQSIEKPTSSIDTIQNIDKPTFSKDVKSKVVYILNDEDIFNTSPVQSSQKTENIDPKLGVTTLGKVYKEIDKQIDKKIDGKSLFGEEVDDEIFKSKVPVKKNTIFDSDSEEDLFADGKQKKKEIVGVKKEIKREVVKGSLFGDDDDDDDLFGVKTKKAVERNSQPARPTSTKEPAKPSEPVFADPLSMFGDDD